MRLYLVRHPETTYNADSNRYCGRTDAALSPRGKEQARRIVRFFAGRAIKGVWCSPLIRSRETAEAIAHERGVPVTVEPDFIEMDFGAWEGVTPEEIEARDPDLWRRWREGDPEAVPPQGEPLEQVFRRTLAGFAKVERALGPDGTGVVIGHSIINRLLIAHLIGLPWHRYRVFLQGNGSISLMERGVGALPWVIHYLNLIPGKDEPS